MADNLHDCDAAGSLTLIFDSPGALRANVTCGRPALSPWRGKWRIWLLIGCHGREARGDIAVEIFSRASIC